ncbi:patatin family protein [Microbulbifer sp. MKSA007]|nr:patatin family protein [Microbulbifer sp. MKSA007]
MEDCILINENSQSALVVEGGAMRGIFAAGVLDAFLEAGYRPFDFAIGVSAGSTNLIGYLAGNHGRSRQILMDHARRADFIDWRRYLRGGHFCDIGWLWHASYQDIPLSVDSYVENGIPLYAVTTSINTGEARYLKVTPENMHEVFPASCAIPVAYRGFPEVDGEPMTDGGLADSIPIIQAYQQGARNITVILSRPLGYRKIKGPAPKFIKQFFRDHARLFEAVLERGRNIIGLWSLSRCLQRDARFRLLRLQTISRLSVLLKKQSCLRKVMRAAGPGVGNFFVSFPVSGTLCRQLNSGAGKVG